MEMSCQWIHRKKVGVREMGSRSSGWDMDRTYSQVCTSGTDLFNQKTSQNMKHIPKGCMEQEENLEILY